MDSITTYRLPSYHTNSTSWEKFRLSYAGGEAFRQHYLKKYTSREDDLEFALRKSITPIPTFAKSALCEIRNSLFQPMVDVIRRGGSDAYHTAAAGRDMGVDRRGSSLNGFMGQQVLEEMLVMGRVGVFIDAPTTMNDATLADAGNFSPYLYLYKIEDILSYSCNDPENPSEFQALLLRDRVIKYDGVTGLPKEEVSRYRHLWKEDGKVMVQFYDYEDNLIDRDGNASGPIQLELERIPFVLLDIGQSLIVDVCEYQIALLNLRSSDVGYAMSSNFPFYTEQSSGRSVGGHLKVSSNPDGTATSGGQGAHVNEVKVGATQGRTYPINMDRPKFIHPSSEPLKASMALQEQMKSDIKSLVNLAVQTLAGRASAESKGMDNRGLEAGLSYIGMKLEAAERQIVEFWAAYEQPVRQKRQIATIKYPDRYSLKSNEDRISEATKLSEVIVNTPSKTAQKELWKTVVSTLLGGKVNPDILKKINQEVDAAKYTTANPEIIIKAKEAGLVGSQLASQALGFPEDEYLVAREDHIARLLAIAKHQGVLDSAPPTPGSRGVVDLDDNTNSGKDEKELSRDTTFQDTTNDRTRGEGK